MLNRFLMIRHGCFQHVFVISFGKFMSDNGTFDSDSLYKAFGNQLLFFHIEQLILERGAPAIDN